MPTLRAVTLSTLALVSACSGVTEIEAPVLEGIVQRDIVVFDVDAPPPELIERLASSRVTVVGETHFLREHREFVGALVRTLHERGYRQLLMEWPHAFDWVLSEYVLDLDPMPGWQPPERLGGLLIEEVRELNRTLSAEDRIRLGALDLNLDEYGGAEVFLTSLRSLAESMDDAGPVGAFLAERYAGESRGHELLMDLQSRLVDERGRWEPAWGEAHYAAVLEMVEVEAASVAVRALRTERYDVSARLREEAIHRIADLRIAETAGGTLINVGLTHAQKGNLLGTADTQWLGEYLARRSPVAGESTFVLGAMAARVSVSGGGEQPQLAGSPSNELLRLMSEAQSGSTAYLPLDDARFLGEGVPLNIEGEVHVCAPKEHFDGLVLFPLAHRDSAS